MTRCIDYDRLAHDYARAHGAIPRVVDAILGGLGERPAKDILEVGCGPADHLHVLSKAFGATGCGFDRSANMLAEAAKKNPGLSLCQGDAAVAYPYPDGRFGLVFSVNVIHYIGDLDRYFAEAMRVLRPGGTVVTVTDSWDDIRRRTMTEYFPETAAAEFQRYQDTPPIERAMRGAGFGDIHLTHSEYHFDLSREYLEKYRQKAFSALHLIDEQAFRAGLARLEAAVAAGGGKARELYTYVWGSRP
ncbi:MAG: class I SAM-dependent methyltransferase [Bacillota bacterium]